MNKFQNKNMHTMHILSYAYSEQDYAHTPVGSVQIQKKKWLHS
jgi:hypothetical protein